VARREGGGAHAAYLLRTYVAVRQRPQALIVPQSHLHLLAVHGDAVHIVVEPAITISYLIYCYSLPTIYKICGV
jgi:hypothetical protein